MDKIFDSIWVRIVHKHTLTIQTRLDKLWIKSREPTRVWRVSHRANENERDRKEETQRQMIWGFRAVLEQQKISVTQTEWIHNMKKLKCFQCIGWKSMYKSPLQTTHIQTKSLKKQEIWINVDVCLSYDRNRFISY